ncbi:protein of unknown function (plasmid) [Azospirillum lipoferum 4B]|uniref:Uncharacterized protein n=1 Tax=Azospirillum lipoferum (strain 4B) TaxID=862719 RepID=G7ZHU2_AZOL4|nr:protein of unknown function [Azospirillum lipoferum 4B]
MGCTPPSCPLASWRETCRNRAESKGQPDAGGRGPVRRRPGRAPGALHKGITVSKRSQRRFMNGTLIVTMAHKHALKIHRKFG